MLDKFGISDGSTIARRGGVSLPDISIDIISI